MGANISQDCLTDPIRGQHQHQPILPVYKKPPYSSIVYCQDNTPWFGHCHLKFPSPKNLMDCALLSQSLAAVEGWGLPYYCNSHGSSYEAPRLDILLCAVVFSPSPHQCQVVGLWVGEHPYYPSGGARPPDRPLMKHPTGLHLWL